MRSQSDQGPQSIVVTKPRREEIASKGIEAWGTRYKGLEKGIAGLNGNTKFNRFSL
jgi:hypothetical protein